MLPSALWAMSTLCALRGVCGASGSAPPPRSPSEHACRGVRFGKKGSVAKSHNRGIASQLIKNTE